MIDVSVHQGKINWEAVKSQIDGTIIRCGYGDDLVEQDDLQWRRNVEECTRLSIPFGVYLYSYAKTSKQAESEARHVLRLIKGYSLSFPVYLDIEEPRSEINAVERARIFGDLIEQEGYWCGIYANEYFWNHYLGSNLDRYTKWVAKYSDKKPNVSGSYDIWQYSSNGKIAGITGRVDCNQCYRDFPMLIRRTREFMVKINCHLNIRKGPGLQYRINDTIRDFGTYTIVQTDGEWGKLKSGAGWINISEDYVTKF